MEAPPILRDRASRTSFTATGAPAKVAFDDVDGTVFDSKVIPNVFPDLSLFEGRTLTVLVFDFTELKSGYVMATLAGVTTPAERASWGALKALYR